MDSEKFDFLMTLLQYPQETATAEYKSGIAFDPSDDFSVKLIKHIMGQANAGGGYIIIGFREDANGKLAPDPGTGASVSGSYETTRLSQSVDRFLVAGQRIELQVHKIEFNSITYPVISVQSFDDSPLFCGRDFNGRDGKPILKAGAIYVRDLAAKTVITAGPDQFKALLKIAVGRRQSEVLSQFRSLLAEMGLSLPSGRTESPDAAVEAEFKKWVQAQRSEAIKRLPGAGNKK